ncbi:flagellar hook capping protein [bacterium]|nr:flagellar hook capping protein [bacterium]
MSACSRRQDVHTQCKSENSQEGDQIMASVDNINSSTDIPIVPADEIGFAGLKSEDFLKILIAQLQNQDPSNPMDSDQLLNQISDMRSLQASIELEKSLDSLTLSQQLNSAAGFLGKYAEGTQDEASISGLVSAVQVKDGSAYLMIGNQELALSNVSGVAEW